MLCSDGPKRRPNVIHNNIIRLFYFLSVCHQLLCTEPIKLYRELNCGKISGRTEYVFLIIRISDWWIRFKTAQQQYNCGVILCQSLVPVPHQSFTGS